jgi:hypothetical protein
MARAKSPSERDRSWTWNWVNASSTTPARTRAVADVVDPGGCDDPVHPAERPRSVGCDAGDAVPVLLPLDRGLEDVANGGLRLVEV